MSVLRDKQESQVVAIVPAADKVIETLNVDDEGVFNKILDELYDAANICKDQFDLILTLQQHLAAGQESRRKEITEAANHALKKNYKAREVLKDSKAVKWPYGFGNPDHDITRTP